MTPEQQLRQKAEEIFIEKMGINLWQYVVGDQRKEYFISAMLEMCRLAPSLTGTQSTDQHIGDAESIEIWRNRADYFDQQLASLQAKQQVSGAGWVKAKLESLIKSKTSGLEMWNTSDVLKWYGKYQEAVSEFLESLDESPASTPNIQPTEDIRRRFNDIFFKDGVPQLEIFQQHETEVIDWICETFAPSQVSDSLTTDSREEEIKRNLVNYFNGDHAAAEMAYSICNPKK